MFAFETFLLDYKMNLDWDERTDRPDTPKHVQFTYFLFHLCIRCCRINGANKRRFTEGVFTYAR